MKGDGEGELVLMGRKLKNQPSVLPESSHVISRVLFFSWLMEECLLPVTLRKPQCTQNASGLPPSRQLPLTLATTDFKSPGKGLSYSAFLGPMRRACKLSRIREDTRLTKVKVIISKSIFPLGPREACPHSCALRPPSCSSAPDLSF